MDGKTIQCLPNPSQHIPIYREQFPSYSNSKCKKIAVFTYRSPHFCFPWRRPCDYHAMCCMDGKTFQYLSNLSQHVPISSTVSQLFEPQVQEITIFTYRSPYFCFPWGRPWGNHAKCCMDGKRIRCLQIVPLHVPILLLPFLRYSEIFVKKLSFYHTPCIRRPR